MNYLVANQNCHRCGKPTLVTKGSYFNTEMLCGLCVEKEQAHPKYKEAVEAENQAVRQGDYNFPGIGKPPDL